MAIEDTILTAQEHREAPADHCEEHREPVCSACGKPPKHCTCPPKECVCEYFRVCRRKFVEPCMKRTKCTNFCEPCRCEPCHTCCDCCTCGCCR